MMLAPELQAAEERQLLLALVHFCQHAGPPHCYPDWSPQLLHDYLCFHATHGTFSYVRDLRIPHSAFRILATGIAWQCHEATIRAAHAAGQHVFDWTPSDDTGDCIFLADIVCRQPDALPLLWQSFEKRFPEWPQLKLFTYRRRQLVQLRPRRFAKFILRACYSTTPHSAFRIPHLLP